MAVSIFIPYLIVVGSGFPFAGLSISFSLLATLVYYIKVRKSYTETLLFLIILALCACLVLRANLFLTFLNVSTILFLGAFYIKPELKDFRFSFFELIFAPISTVWKSFQTKNEYTWESAFSASSKIVNLSKTLKTVAMTSAILIVIIPLLASANPIFSKLVTNVFDVKRILEFLLPKDVEIIFFRIFLFAILAYFLPRILSYANIKEMAKEQSKEFLNSDFLWLPKIAISIVLFVFFITQIQLYFASQQTLYALGYTNSSYTREVFGQLTLVAAIVIGILYNDKKRTKKEKITTLFLLFECYFLAMVAFKSDYDYSNAWGFTQKRLWGFTGVTWLILVLLLYIYIYLKRYEQARFVKGVLAISSSLLLIVNILNFDYLIYHFRKSTTQDGVDYQYISQLSPDAQAYYELATQFPSIYTANNIRALQNKYREFDFRSFNFSEFQQFLAIKSINPQDVENKSYPLYTSTSDRFLVPMSAPYTPPIKKPIGDRQLVLSKEGYSVSINKEWKQSVKHPDEYAFELVKCMQSSGSCDDAEQTAEASLLFKHPIASGLSMSNNYMMSVNDWVLTNLPMYWFNERTRTEYPFDNEILTFESWQAIMRSTPGTDGTVSRNKTFYVPLRNNILEVELIVNKNLSTFEVDKIYGEVKEILSTYQVTN